ncbi:inactive serine/threonine-protein kinase PLK5-like isoform X4 [Poecile atricapillus]|uniref:inactive serine/threonine-protein kinase PLK5-like isoform X4 n=1 Tax=Poecile atricapillus TaxID=48891 RepID=UPI002739D1F6|nr:inactive serine/threonine-protein kinase PLK5-like isoform X4 [Poecile atricapillus]
MVPRSAGAEPPPAWYLRDWDSGALYKRGRLLGEGTFGRCYQVTEVTSGRLYAAKLIPRARLATAAIGDRPLSLCPQSLADILRARGRLTEPEVRYYLRQLLSGLRYLHGHGLVHRDLKLSNFLVTERMRVKIGDLGLARRAAPPGRRWGALCGTPAYLAPEVLERRGHAVPSDVWALGCAVYTALTGHAPFEARHRPELYRRIRGARYPLPPQLSPRARALIAHMLDPEPAARPSLAGVLGHPFLTQGFTPQALPPRACHSVPIFVGQEPLRRILRGLRCWRGCGCVPVTPGGGRAPPQST